MLNKILKIILVLDLVAVNGLLIYQLTILNSQIISNELISKNETSVEQIDQCGEECREEIRNQVANLQIKDQKLVLPTMVPTVTPTPKPVVKSVVKKVRREEILTIPGSGSTGATDWANLSGTEFYFDTRDYPGLVEVYFEANMRLVSGGGSAYVRLYDVTNNISPVGGQNDTKSQVDIWTKSQKVYFWAGKNLIRVQAKTLVPDTTVYNSGKLRIVTEN